MRVKDTKTQMGKWRLGEHGHDIHMEIFTISYKQVLTYKLYKPRN